MRILMILIPDGGTPGSRGDPAVRLERAAGPFYAFRDAAAEVVLASPDGGSPLLEFAGHGEASSAIIRRLRQDRAAMDEFSDTLRLDQVYADDFDAAFCVGLPGPIWRSEPRDPAGALIAKLLEAGKPVAVMPSGLDIAPRGAGEGLLIIGDDPNASIPAARALMSAIRKIPIKPERNAT